MIVSFSLSGPKLQHATRQQFGAIVAHCMKLKNFHSIEVFKTLINIRFALNEPSLLVDQVKIQQQLETEIEALSNMEPFPCPCGCGEFLAIGPCLRQSGALQEGDLTVEEAKLAREHQLIASIKLIRARTGLGLKDAKDVLDKWRAERDLVGPNKY